MNKSITLRSLDIQIKALFGKKGTLSKSGNLLFWGTLQVNTIEGTYTTSRAI